MLVTTPEKWDVVTRKSTGDVALTQIVKLLIIDEVHLLHDERGSVIECLVARTLRQVGTCQLTLCPSISQLNIMIMLQLRVCCIESLNFEYFNGYLGCILYNMNIMFKQNQHVSPTFWM